MQLNEVASHVKIVKSTGAGAISNLTKIFGPEATDNTDILFLTFFSAKVQNK